MSTDPVFLVTGASGGIGEASARLAAEQGYRVVLAARRADEIGRLAEELGGPARARAVPTDVSDWSANEELIAQALDAFGRLDVVLANAGFGAKQGWLEDTPERWRSMVLTNVLGTAYTMRAAIPAVTEKRGHLVIMGSLGGRRVRPGSFYSCTKFATVAMGEALRQDLHGSGVRVTVVEPGTVDTEFFDTPRQDALLAEDVARAVMYAVDQPPHVDVNEILVRPISQAL
jgi:NADP-dependent 3-hydroxy acid dehydrogenase YdfG